MSLLDPIKPYLTLIKWGIAALLLGVAFFGGCSCQKEKEMNKRAELTTVIEAQKAQIAVLNTQLNDVSSQTKANKKAAEDAAKLAEQYAEEAAKAKAQLDKKQEEWDRKFAKAKNDPDCKELLRMKLCPLITDF